GLTGRRDVVAGVPVAGRRGAVQRQALGYFVNMLPLPVDLARHETFAELVGDISAKTFTLLRHQDFDLAEHADEVLPGHRGPLLVDNAFTYYKQTLAPRLAGCRVEPLPVRRASVKYPLGMNVEDRGDAYVLTVEHVERLTAADPAACLEHVLRTALEDPDVALDRLGLLSPAREAALAELTGLPRQYPTPPSLDDWFHATAARRGAATAIVDGADETSYAELDAAVDRVADALDELGAGAHVGIAMNRGRDLVAVILGVLRAGRTYVPIDPGAPAERVRHIVGRFDDLMLVADEGALEDVDGVRRVAPSEVLAERSPGAGAGARRRGADRRGEVAYVIFTSGSTGVPKGVQVTHGNVLRLFTSAEDHFDFGQDDTWCLFHSYAFDFSVWEIFGALLYGGRLVVVPQLTTRSPEMFAELLTRERVTVLNQTPSAFRQLTAVLPPGAARHVRWVVFGGEALRFDALRPWVETQGERARLVNMYGITETTVHVTFFEVDPATVAVETDSVIGRPLGDLSVAVVDTNLNRCAPTVPGELLVAGDGVSLGYRGQPDLTAARFLRGTPYGEVVYRTGDRVSVRADGTLVYHGRIDRQVQLRGHRIELGEVEAGLLAVPGMRQCVVRLDERPGVEPRLVGYLVGDPPDDAEVRRCLSSRLPRYMVPSILLRLDAVPLTVNGKVAEDRLPLPGAPAAVEVASVGIDDELTAAVARIWMDVVQTGPVRADDNFFDIGGTSMHVTEVHRRLAAELGAHDLAVVDLFEFTTPASLAERLRRDRPEPPSARPARPPARRVRTRTFPTPQPEQELAS
ncbi:MAG: non-ribosomal peptide synthetase, partial [Actinomycetes bacterium]